MGFSASWCLFLLDLLRTDRSYRWLKDSFWTFCSRIFFHFFLAKVSVTRCFSFHFFSLVGWVQGKLLRICTIMCLLCVISLLFIRRL